MCCDLSPTRRPASRAGLLGLAVLLAIGLTGAGCGNKRPPKAPPRIVPATTTDLVVSQRGTELQFALTYPAVTIGGLPLDGLEAVELWRYTRPLVPPPAEEEEGAPADDEETEAEPEVVEEPEEEAPARPFLFRRPVVAAAIRAEDRVQVDPREFLALAQVEQRIEGPELQAAINGDRILLRLPLGELPPAEVPEEERDIELFAVITVSTRGLGSELSNVVKILPRTPPVAPSRIETQPGADGINLVWTADDPEVGFRVYRREAASRVYGLPIAEPAPEARSHRDQTALFGSSYVYSVTRVSQPAPLVESALATEREVQYDDRYPPAPPGGLIVLAEAGQVRILWEPSEASDLAGYLVYRRAGDGAGFDRLTAEPGLDLEFLDTTVDSGRSYSYYVSAIDRSGNESEASETVDAEVP